MSIIIESEISTIVPPSEEGVEDDVEIEPCEPLVVAPTPSETTLTKMDNYDEDLNANPFFQSFMVSCPDLFSRCVQEQWLICVPRRDSLPKYAFTLEDFAHHILRPLPRPCPLHQRHYSEDSDGISSCVSGNGDPDGSFVSSRSSSSCGGLGGGDAPSRSMGSDEQNFSFNMSSTSLVNASFLSTITAGSGVSSTSNLKGNWNYRTLSHVNVEYAGTTLIMDIEVPLIMKGSTSSNERQKEAVDQLSPLPEKYGDCGPFDSSNLSLTVTSTDGSEKDISMDDASSKYSSKSKTRVNVDDKEHPRVQLRKEVLFEETFYTMDRQKYKVLCVASPLNSKVDMEDDNFGNAGLGLWNLTSLRDCIDFLWVKGSPKLLATFDAYIKLFQHNHRGLENFPLKVQKDLVHTLYLKCLNYAITNGGIVSSEPSPENQALNEFFLQRLRLATETYVMNGTYRSVISALTSCVSTEDARLNKVMRNLTELHPQDLDINNIHWDNMTRARQELGRLNAYSSPLGKLTCMKRTLRYLRPESFPDSDGGCPLAADELIPIWVYLVVKNPLGNWMAQLDFLRHFRFSVEGGQQPVKDNENSFYITTLEASLEHLRSGKVLGMNSDSERDVGMPCDLGEAWLHSVHAKAMECTDTPLGEMFDVIRLGNCARLEELIEEYEVERVFQQEKLKETQRPYSDRKSVDFQGLCHPLCQCESCVKLMIKTMKEMEIADEEEITPPAVNLKTSEGLSLLHVACIYGRPRIVEWLIEAGADLEARDIDNMTPLHFCASRGHQNALLLLLDADAYLEPRNVALNTPLHLASQNGHEGCVKALIYDSERRGKKLNLSARNQKGDTPLHYASRWGFQGIVQILVEHGAAIKIHNIRHVTPLDCAHDIHILKILQRSLRRRSLVEINHGDFINIEMVQKEESGGIVMLITEPKEPPSIESKITLEDNISLEHMNNSKNRSGNNTRNASRSTSAVPSRKTSSTIMPDLIPVGVTGGTPANTMARSRKASSIINPMKGINEEITTKSLLQDVADNLEYHQRNTRAYIDRYLSASNMGECDHIRKVSVQSLEDCRIASAESAFTGLVNVMADTKEHDTRKIFSAIHQQDLPLALFYLGIPAEELANPENDLETVSRIPECHPLCPCTRCVAKNAGLGLGLNVKNPEGYTALHIAVEQRLPALVKILVRYRADINCQSTHDKKTPLDIAKEKGFHDIEDFLQSHGGTCTTSFALEPQEFWGTQ